MDTCTVFASSYDARQAVVVVVIECDAVKMVRLKVNDNSLKVNTGRVPLVTFIDLIDIVHITFLHFYSIIIVMFKLLD